MYIFLIILIIPLFTSCSKDNLLSVHIIDVGQGDSILIQTPNSKNILIDSGDESSEHIVNSYLKYKNINSLDIVIASHYDSDHIGSLDYIIENFHVKSVYGPSQVLDSNSYKNLINACSTKNITLKYLSKGDYLNIENNINISILSPSNIQSENNLNSIVMKLDYNDKSFLFTGDSEVDNESEIINSFNLDDVDFLKVAHHGSSSSTSIDFLEETTPDVAVISCGYKNQYGHPHKSTLDNLKRFDILTYRTDISGDMTFYSDGKEIFTKKKYKLN